MRKKTRAVRIGDVTVGGGAPVVVQSMTNTDTRDPDTTLRQIAELRDAGCEVVRLAVPDAEAAEALKVICPAAKVPLVADIHYDYRLALAALDAGINGLRINPGNIGSKQKVREIVAAAKERGVPIRIGVNAGSLHKKVLEKYGLTPQALVESAKEHIYILEALNFNDIKVSLKASDVPLMIEAYRLISTQFDYPLHIGVTEAGTLRGGLVKSSVGLGILLAEGIGDTIRVSLTAHPRYEVWAAWEILKALKLRRRGVELISCPTCGRTAIDVISIAAEVEDKLQNITKPLKVAVMGCVVNGPGEAREADVGIAGGKGVGLVFRKGKPVRRVPEGQLVTALLEEIAKL
ncbi:MAG: flavodoxin-dependent (E)-4-hydroxy-3-methylbut-2-enyl-diphosphate synthase [Peptococcaceae bacterium]|nr:flavodoxin-dependent (E)-4-hydroxy-3-methylbut-2-enyl-diphosphate synthase [Peptococcaceae bacterium]